MPDASPTKWHLAHTSWFFEQFVLAALEENHRVYDPKYAYLFNSYYNAVGSRHPRPQRGLLTRPSLADVLAYRQVIDERMALVLQSADDAQLAEIAPVIEVGLNHEQQHQELLLTDLKHLLSCNPLEPTYMPRDEELTTTGSLPPLGWQEYEANLHEMGHGGSGFHYDNEAPRHRVFLEAFALAERPVTCGEFVEFIKDKGYERPELWLAAGWDTVQRESWTAPLYWWREANDWSVFTLSGRRPLEMTEPVSHISFFEADAYARWAGARLPTEAEWEIVVAEQSESGHMLDVNWLHPRPLQSRSGMQALFGDVWEWTGSSYRPYPGYQPPPGALGEYNGKFMCNQSVLRGGSCATPVGHIRTTYRNFFPPDARWQFSGLRLARDLHGEST
jgi:ergothioneine biosynthesis protein EgtB